jgi:hypothetical protein
MTQSQAPRFCTSCGKPVSGRYCADCGAPNLAAAERIEATAAESWSELASEFVGQTSNNSVPSIMTSMLKAPFSTIMRLAEDPTYMGAWKFFLSMLGLYLTFTNIALPRLVALIQHKSFSADQWLIFSEQMQMILAFGVLALAMYYACRLISRRKRSPRAYMRAASLTWGYWFLLAMLATVAFLVVLSGLRFVVLGLGGARLSQPLQEFANAAAFVIYEATILFVVIMITRRFWGIGSLTAAAIAAGYVLVSQLLVFPAVSYLANTMNLTGNLKQLFGN